MPSSTDLVPAAALWRCSAADLARGYAAGAFTPADALRSVLERIAAVQPRLNAFVHLDAQGARAAADASARRWAAGAPLGPLDGVPISLKDNLHAAGMPTSWGSRALSGHMPAADELPVARLRAAGAVLLGKTNLPEFAMQGITANDLHGTTRNPWDLRCTPGGSSGGAAAAVAAGCGPLALATDGGGSTRRPASHTGLVGFKPSGGALARAGGLPEIFLAYEVPGLLARTVDDVVAAWRVLAGAPVPTGPAPALRMLLLPRFAGHPVDPSIDAAVRAAAQGWKALGHTVQEAPAWHGAEPLHDAWPRLSGMGLAWMLAHADLPDARLRDTGQWTPASRAALRAGQAEPADALFDLLQQVRQLQAAADALFAQADVLLTPATAALPWTLDQTHPPRIDGQDVGPRGHAVFTAFANAAGLPAIAVPTGLAGALPTGFQLVAPRGHDARLLALARQWEQAHPWAHLWPDLP